MYMIIKLFFFIQPRKVKFKVNREALITFDVVEVSLTLVQECEANFNYVTLWMVQEAIQYSGSNLTHPVQLK